MEDEEDKKKKKEKGRKQVADNKRRAELAQDAHDVPLNALDALVGVTLGKSTKSTSKPCWYAPEAYGTRKALEQQEVEEVTGKGLSRSRSASEMEVGGKRKGNKEKEPQSEDIWSQNSEDLISYAPKNSPERKKAAREEQKDNEKGPVGRAGGGGLPWYEHLASNEAGVPGYKHLGGDHGTSIPGYEHLGPAASLMGMGGGGVATGVEALFSAVRNREREAAVEATAMHEFLLQGGRKDARGKDAGGKDARGKDARGKTVAKKMSKSEKAKRAGKHNLKTVNMLTDFEASKSRVRPPPKERPPLPPRKRWEPKSALVVAPSAPESMSAVDPPAPEASSAASTMAASPATSSVAPIVAPASPVAASPAPSVPSVAPIVAPASTSNPAPSTPADPMSPADTMSPADSMSPADPMSPAALAAAAAQMVDLDADGNMVFPTTGVTEEEEDERLGGVDELASVEAVMDAI